MALKYFHREFLGNPDDENDPGSYISVRVRETDEDMAAATLTLSDGYDTVRIPFFVFGDTEKNDKKRTLDKLKRLKGIMDKFLLTAEDELGKL